MISNPNPILIITRLNPTFVGTLLHSDTSKWGTLVTEVQALLQRSLQK